MAISFTIEPFEANFVVYQRVAPLKQGEPTVGMLYFYLDITNTGEPVTLSSIDISFPNSAQPACSYARSQAIKSSRREWLVESEVIKLTTTPTKIRVSLKFTGVPAPVVKEWNLGPHKISYRFFAKPEDIKKYGEYITLHGGHLGDSGSQQLAQDAGAVGWRDGKLDASRTGSNLNTDRFLFGRPFYAMGDGWVVGADDSNEDNPAPGMRAINRMPGTWQGSEKVADLAVCCLRRSIPNAGKSNRILIASISTQGTLKLTALEQTDKGDKISPLRELRGSPAEDVEIVALDDLYAVTASRSGNATTLSLWELTLDGSILHRDQVVHGGCEAVKLLALSSTLFITATRASGGMVALTVWHREGNALKPEPSPAGSLGPAGVFDFAPIDASRFAIAAQTKKNGNLKVIAWAYESDGGGGSGGDNGPGQTYTTSDLVRIGEDSGGPVSEVAGVRLTDVDKFGVAVRQEDGTMKFIVYDASDGAVTRKKEHVRDAPASRITAAAFKSESIAVLSRTQAGKMHLTALDIELSEKTGAISIAVSSDNMETAGTTDLFVAATMPTAQTTLVTVVRTADGFAKVILWQCSNSNFIKVLHGSEIVTCVHLMKDSIPNHLIPKDKPVAVKEGDLIGRMGNSGKSAGPHLHISADRVKPEYLGDVPKLIERIRAGETVSVIRPMQFKGARAMRNKDVKPGGAATNPLVELNGHGIYFNEYVILPDGG